MENLSCTLKRVTQITEREEADISINITIRTGKKEDNGKGNGKSSMNLFQLRDRFKDFCSICQTPCLCNRLYDVCCMLIAVCFSS